MVELIYLDFDLSIEKGYLARGRDFRGREATRGFRVPFDEAEIEDFWRRIGASPSRTRRLTAPGASPRKDGPAPDRKADLSKHYGGWLFEALFRDNLLRSFSNSLEEANDEGKGLRIRLHLTDVPELAKLPWEYLYDSDCNRHFALSWKTPIVRYLELPTAVPKLTVRPPLKMLVMVAGPSGCPPLDGEREWERLNGELGKLREMGLIELEPLRRATLPDLQRRLRRGGAHIFHFIGHGNFDPRSREGTLILEDESGRASPASAEHLGVLLHDSDVRLAVLNACLGARASPMNSFSGVAQALTQQGVPAVVAMQSEIGDDFALILARELYGALADGFPVDACLAEARKALNQEHHADWGSPVLYLRARDGWILHVARPDEKREETKASAGRRAWLKWAGVAALAVVALLFAFYRWRESRSAVDRAQAIFSEGDRAQEIAGEEATAESEPPSSEEDRVAQGHESGANEPAPERPEPVVKRPEPEELEVFRDAGAESKQTARPEVPRPEVPPTPPIASSWPQGNRQQRHRNPKDGQDYIWIPEGVFSYGCSPGDDLCEDDETPRSHQVIEHGFWLGRTEVTVRAYKRFKEDPSQLPVAPSFNSDWEDESQPMVNLSRTDAKRFCEWATARLPTEIEWEYAARAGEPRSLPEDLADRAWFAGQSGGRARPVSQKEPNMFGLYDMLGNAAEWVAPSPDDPVELGILRGGSFRHEAKFLRFSFGLSDGVSERNEMYGFRCLAEPLRAH